MEDDLDAFVAHGETMLASETGDLDGDGRPDAVLVVDPPLSAAADEQSSYRTVVLLVRDAQGRLQKAAQNSWLVPCATCGGVSGGDPFGYARIDRGRLTLVVEGGSRERWSSEYVFKHDAARKDWLLEKVERSAFDQISQQSVSKTFTHNDFGNVTFSDFDPSTLPEVAIP